MTKTKFAMPLCFATAAVCILWAFGGIFGGLVFAYVAPSWVEFPLSGAKGIVVLPGEQIACGSRYYSRLQLYEHDGTFIRGWYLDVGQGDFAIRLRDGNRIEVAAARTQALLTYDAKGTLVERQSDPAAYARTSSVDPFAVRDAQGRTFRIVTPWLWPRITLDDGRSTTVIAAPSLFGWLMMAPVPSFLWGLVGTALLVFGNVLRMRSAERSRFA